MCFAVQTGGLQMRIDEGNRVGAAKQGQHQERVRPPPWGFKVTDCDLKGDCAFFAMPVWHSKIGSAFFEVTVCDFKFFNSCSVSWNIKSSGKRSRFRWTALLRCPVSTP